VTAGADRPAALGEAAASALNAGLATGRVGARQAAAAPGRALANSPGGSRRYPVTEPAPGRYAKQK
jgi:hypothetical protein